jgi:hypothetical protein
MRPYAAVAVVFLLAGCTSAPTVGTSLHIAYGGSRAPLDATVQADLGAHPASHYYQAQNLQPPTFYTAFDQVVQWAEASGVALNVSHASFGFFLAQIDHAPATGSSSYWALTVNGTMSQVGMDQVHVVGGSHITWTLSSF